MTSGCTIVNKTDHDVKIEVFSSYVDRMHYEPIHTHIIGKGERRSVNGTRLRFIMGNTHYLLDAPSKDEIYLTEPSILHAKPERKITSFPCSWPEIHSIIEDIDHLHDLIENSKEKDAEVHKEALSQREKELHDMVGKEFGKSISRGRIRLLAGAATAGTVAPAAVVTTIQGVGFTASGISSGSYAASMMSYFGTTSGGIVATCQSIGATGSLSLAATGGVALIGAATVGIAGYGCMKLHEKLKHDPDSCWDSCYAKFQHQNQRKQDHKV